MQGAFVVGWLLNALRNEHAHHKMQDARSLAPRADA
jgi:hypothetical protein